MFLLAQCLVILKRIATPWTQDIDVIKAGWEGPECGVIFQDIFPPNIQQYGRVLVTQIIEN